MKLGKLKEISYSKELIVEWIYWIEKVYGGGKKVFVM
jgi:hypothetical protein